jgi:ABC-type glycerol-3-phosphate transport system substrate-binding protein
MIRAYAQAWASRHAATLEVQVADTQKGFPEAADVWVLPPAELPHYAATGKLLPLSEAFTAREAPFAWTDLLPAYRSQLLSWGQTAYGVPLTGEAPLCCYRLDQFKDRPAPRTWEQFAEAAEFFSKNGKPSLPALPADDDALDRLFWTVAASYARKAVPPVGAEAVKAQQEDLFGFYYDLKTGQPRLNAPGFVHGLEMLQRLQHCTPSRPGTVPEQDFLEGKAVLCVTDACWLATFQHSPAMRDKIGICRIPGAAQYFTFGGEPRRVAEGNWVPYLGGAGWVGVVPRSAEHAAAAFDLMAELAGPQTSGQMMLAPRWGTAPTREEQLRNERWDAFGFDTAMTNRLRDVLQETLLHHNIRNPLLCLRTPNASAHRQALVAELRRALETEGISAAAALSAAAGKWRELDQKQGLAEHLLNYRLSLGLLGGGTDRTQ